MGRNRSWYYNFVALVALCEGLSGLEIWWGLGNMNAMSAEEIIVQIKVLPPVDRHMVIDYINRTYMSEFLRVQGEIAKAPRASKEDVASAINTVFRKHDLTFRRLAEYEKLHPDSA